ncbi:MAG: hypothetical protein ACI9XR_001265 [Flavobacterium sp.]|jgi:hypothetical protein
MKTKLFFLGCLSLLFATNMMAQNRTTVNALSSEISDNLDLRAVASIFGESRDLEDFEQRLNNPNLQLSNLDLNNDNQVDYLRVIESVEGNAHIIVIQSVIGRDLFQDVATVEIQKLENNRVQVQVVGDVYMYGNNYIYEPVYVATPIIYTSFWTPRYSPYVSSFNWGDYPSYYSFWNPYPVFLYRNNISIHINLYNTYNYVNNRHCLVAYNNYYGRRANGYERQYPNRSFNNRNSGFTNRYDYDKSRSRKDVAYNVNGRSNTRNDNSYNSTRSNSNSSGTRNYNSTSTRNENATNSSTKGNTSNSPRNSNGNSTRNTSTTYNGSRSENATNSSTRGNTGNSPRNSNGNSTRNTTYNGSRSENSNNSVSSPRNQANNRDYSSNGSRNQTSSREYNPQTRSNSNSGSISNGERTERNSQSSGSNSNYSQNNSNRNTASSGNSRGGNSRENFGSRR